MATTTTTTTTTTAADLDPKEWEFPENKNYAKWTIKNPDPKGRDTVLYVYVKVGGETVDNLSKGTWGEIARNLSKMGQDVRRNKVHNEPLRFTATDLTGSAPSYNSSVEGFVGKHDAALQEIFRAIAGHLEGKDQASSAGGGAAAGAAAAKPDKASSGAGSATVSIQDPPSSAFGKVHAWSKAAATSINDAFVEACNRARSSVAWVRAHLPGESSAPVASAANDNDDDGKGKDKA